MQMSQWRKKKVKCDACGYGITYYHKIKSCRELNLCKRCSEVELIKESDDPVETIAMIRVSLKEAHKRLKRK